MTGQRHRQKRHTGRSALSSSILLIFFHIQVLKILVTCDECHETCQSSTCEELLICFSSGVKHGTPSWCLYLAGGNNWTGTRVDSVSTPCLWIGPLFHLQSCLRCSGPEARLLSNFKTSVQNSTRRLSKPLQKMFWGSRIESAQRRDGQLLPRSYQCSASSTILCRASSYLYSVPW